MMTGKAGAMVRRYAAAIIAPLVLLAVSACSDGRGDPDPERPAPAPLFYEIASADGAIEGWMLGTIHALPDDTDWRTPQIGRVIDAADLLVVEVGELRRSNRAASLYEKLAHSPGHPPLAERVHADLRPQLGALIIEGGLDARDFTRQESWAAALALARIDAPGTSANGVDAKLVDEFAGQRPVRELEGLRGQLSIFDSLSEPQQRAMLAAVVRESAEPRRDPERLLRAWLAGDAATIEASTREGILADPGLREALLTSRNRRWAAALVPLLGERPRPLIAVGTAHLVGPEGLAALIAAQGYRVRRIATAAAPAP